MSLVTQAYYLSVFVMSFLFFNYLSSKLLWNIIIVKMSQGKKILVHVYGLDGWYWSNGTLEDMHLRYETKEGDKKSLTINDEKYIGREYNLPVVVTDSIKNGVWKPRLEGIEGHDAKATDNIIKTALNKPSTGIDEVVVKVAALAAVVAAVGVGFLIYKFLPLEGMIGQILEAIKGLSTVRG